MARLRSLDRPFCVPTRTVFFDVICLASASIFPHRLVLLRLAILQPFSLFLLLSLLDLLRAGSLSFSPGWRAYGHSIPRSAYRPGQPLRCFVLLWKRAGSRPVRPSSGRRERLEPGQVCGMGVYMCVCIHHFMRDNECM